MTSKNVEDLDEEDIRFAMFIYNVNPGDVSAVNCAVDFDENDPAIRISAIKLLREVANLLEGKPTNVPTIGFDVQESGAGHTLQ